MDSIAALADCGAGSRRTISIAGKAVRRSGRRGRGLAPLHLVSAWATNSRVTLGQVSVPEGSNEIAVIPELLSVLELNGALVTLDAAGSAFVEVPAGAYVVEGLAVTGLMSAPAPLDVTVSDGAATSVPLDYDTGIR